MAVRAVSGYSLRMADEKDLDKLERKNRPPSTEMLGASGTGKTGGARLGSGEPVDDNAESQRQQLLNRIEEKENTLQYMGEGHPKRAQFEHELTTMKKMLEQIDAAIGTY